MFCSFSKGNWHAQGSDKYSNSCKMSGDNNYGRSKASLCSVEDLLDCHPFCKAVSWVLVAGTPQLCLNQLQSLTPVFKNLQPSSFPVSSDKPNSLQHDWKGWTFLRSCPLCLVPLQKQLCLMSASRPFSQTCPAPFIQLCRHRRLITTPSSCL